MGMMSPNGTVSRRNVLKSLGVTGVTAIGTGTVFAQGRQDGDSPNGPPGKGRTELTILHDTHVHGRYGKADETDNIETYFGLMDTLASQAEHAIRLGNGDDIASSALSTKFKGRHIVDAFEAAGISHDTFGNHDFDFGPETLRKRVAEGTFQWVTANVVDNKTGNVFAKDQGVKRFDITEVEDVSVGITGMITERASEVTNLGDNKVIPPAEAIGTVVPEMRSAGAQVVIVLSHVANDVAREVARNVNGIDVIVGDDAAEVLGAEERNNTVLAFVGDGYDHLGELTLDIRGHGKRIHGYDFTLYDTSKAGPRLNIEPDRDVEIVADSYRNRIEREVIGRSTVQLNCRTEDLRTQETNMGNFVADTIKNDVKSDVVIQNGGGIRTDKLYPAGDITDLLIRQILPFGNITVKLKITGQTLVDALENGVSAYQNLEGRFPQVSGMQFTWDPNASAGNRIKSVTVNGNALDKSAMYTLGTNNFMADGGDGYDMLTDASKVQEGQDLADAVIKRIKKLTPISPEVEGRITRA